MALRVETQGARKRQDAQGEHHSSGGLFMSPARSRQVSSKFIDRPTNLTTCLEPLLERANFTVGAMHSAMQGPVMIEPAGDVLTQTPPAVEAVPMVDDSLVDLDQERDDVSALGRSHLSPGRHWRQRRGQHPQGQ